MSESAYRREACAVITGNFDGVHRGHIRLIEKLREVAAEKSLTPLVVSFEPHTRKVVKGIAVPLLTTLAEKTQRFKIKYDLDLVVLPFDSRLQKMSAEEYAREILVEKLGAKVWVRGANHRYGSGGRRGECFPFIECVDVDLNRSGDRVISSTEIREAIQRGDVELANELLGYDYGLEGLVVEGDRRGRTLGFPTANLKVDHPEKMIPPDGVYGGYVHWNGTGYLAVANLGARPSFDADDFPRIEVHLLDFNENLYGKALRFCLLKKIRNSRAFVESAMLQRQIAQDVVAWRKNGSKLFVGQEGGR